MNKELQDKAWSVLPKEFKEEMKKMYCTPKLHSEQYTLLQRLFGGNLTSCTESKEETDKHFDNILKDSFRNERRLNIAVQLVCAIIPKFKDDGDGIGLSVLNEKDMIKCAYRLADYLIAKCEEGGSHD